YPISFFTFCILTLDRDDFKAHGVMSLQLLCLPWVGSRVFSQCILGIGTLLCNHFFVGEWHIAWRFRIKPWQEEDSQSFALSPVSSICHVCWPEQPFFSCLMAATARTIRHQPPILSR